VGERQNRTTARIPTWQRAILFTEIAPESANQTRDTHPTTVREMFYSKSGENAICKSLEKLVWQAFQEVLIQT
jgi:hypothetical protein